MMNKEIYCDSCGCEIHNVNECKMYRSGPPYYETIYICKECSDNGSAKEETEGLLHVDMDGGEAL